MNGARFIVDSQGIVTDRGTSYRALPPSTFTPLEVPAELGDLNWGWITAVFVAGFWLVSAI